MDLSWFKPRGYSHFDAPVGIKFATKALDPTWVAKHSWLPHIHYVKKTKRYKPKKGKTEVKERPIMYASHRDACILSKYASDLNSRLDAYYEDSGLSDVVIAYRKLGKSNYNFSAEALHVARANPGCIVLCYDISGFFDNLDHRLLKDRLKRILAVKELSDDWFAVFRQVTKFKVISRSNLIAHAKFGPRLSLKLREPLATISEILGEGIPIETNRKGAGIPQGTPISAALSNLYMVDLDRLMAQLCSHCGALYRRYSDDILIVCSPADEPALTAALESSIKTHLLEIKPEKTERCVFDKGAPEAIQYLGFNISPNGATIRPGSLARQWRKARRGIAKTKKAGAAAIASGKSTKTYTKKLRRRFLPVGIRNFSAYARRSAKAFEDKTITRQALRLERMVSKALAEIDS